MTIPSLSLPWRGARRRGWSLSRQPARWAGSLRILLAHGLAYLAVALAYFLGATAPLEHGLLELQYRLLPRDATGTLAVIEIDSRSLKALDTWPWPRTYHAALVDRLAAAGARVIAYDIDFSSRSTPEADADLAAAIARAGDRVVLPVFKQRASATETSDESYSAPIEALQANARLATVTIQPRSDGQIWVGRATDMWRGWRLPSMAGLLAGREAWRQEPFLIDYGIRPETLPHLSFADVMSGRFDPAAVAGKSVIVGATVVELGDYFPVPVYAQLPAVFIQALAYESLVQGTAATPAPATVVLMIMLLVSVPVGYWFTRVSWRRAGLSAAGVLVGIVAGSIIAKSHGLPYVETAPSFFGIAVAYGASILHALDRQAQHIYAEHMNAVHQRLLTRAAVEASFDGIVVADQSGVIQTLNPAAAAMLGYEADACVGRPIEAVIPWHQPVPAGPGSLEPAPDPLHIGTTLPIDISLSRAGREPIEVEITASKAVMDPDPRLGAPGAVYVYTIHDVTLRKRSEEATRQAKEQAVANDRAKTEFLANMSHELRTPLNAIIGFSEMMSAEMLGPLGALQYVGYARDIHQSGAHLLGIIDDILDVSQIELGQFRFREEAVDLIAALDSAVRLVSLRLREKEIRIEIEIDDGLPRLWADDRAVKQMLVNLLTNAAKFTAAGGDVSIHARLGASGEMIVSVSDTGIGMPPDVLAKATEAFYQAEQASARSRDGLGLGLFIVHGLMKLHGGSLALESTVGVGTTVTLTFPTGRTRPPSQS